MENQRKNEEVDGSSVAELSERIKGVVVVANSDLAPLISAE